MFKIFAENEVIGYTFPPLHEKSSNLWKPIKNVCKLKMARYPWKKGAKESDRYRPKKKRPSTIHTKPTPYYTQLTNVEDTPPEYTALPVPEVLELLQNAKLYKLMVALKGRLDKPTLRSLNMDEDVHTNVNLLKELSKKHNDTEGDMIARRFELALESGGEADELNALKPLEELQNRWEVKEAEEYKSLLNRKFNELIALFKRMECLGSTYEEFRDVCVWSSYGLFDDLPNTSFVDRYIWKHSLEWRPHDEGDVMSSIKAAFQEMGVLEVDGSTVNISKIEEMRNDEEGVRRLMSIKDYYMKTLYPTYEPIHNVTLLESYLEAPYRRTTLKRDLQMLFDKWVAEGCPAVDNGRRDDAQTQSNIVLSNWKAMPKNMRKRMLYEYQMKRRRELKRQREEVGSALLMRFITPQPSQSEGRPMQSGREYTSDRRRPQPSYLKKLISQTNKLPTKVETSSVESRELEAEEMPSDGREESFIPSAAIIVYDDDAYEEEAFLHALMGEIPKMSRVIAKSVWDTMKLVGKATAARVKDLNTAEGISLYLQSGTPKIWAEATQLQY